MQTSRDLPLLLIKCFQRLVIDPGHMRYALQHSTRPVPYTCSGYLARSVRNNYNRACTPVNPVACSFQCSRGCSTLMKTYSEQQVP